MAQIMKLARWLEKNNLTATEFARQIGAAQATVTRYVNGDRRPSPDMMQVIREATDGKVQPNDFYEAREAAE